MTTLDFELTARRLRPMLLGVGRRFFGDGQRADDVAQETLMRLWTVWERLTEIPAFNTEGGNIWADARRRISEQEEQGRQDEVSGQDRRLARANDGRGFGWNRVVIDGITVRDGTVRYGVTTLPEFTGQTFRGTWFSACDFELKRTADLP